MRRPADCQSGRPNWKRCERGSPNWKRGSVNRHHRKY